MAFGASKYGMVFTEAAPAPAAEAASNGAVAPSAAGFVGSPLFWLLAIAGTAFGLVGVSTSARIGPFSGSISAGTS